MAGWHHQLDGHEFEQALGVGDGQGGLMCYSPWGHKESDTTEQLNNNKFQIYTQVYTSKKNTITNSSVHLITLHQVTN